jgi:hypothetical protein
MATIKNPSNNYEIEINPVPTFILSMLFGPIYYGIIGLWGYFIASLVVNLIFVISLAKEPLISILMIFGHLFICSRIYSARINKYQEKCYLYEEEPEWSGGTNVKP